MAFRSTVIGPTSSSESPMRAYSAMPRTSRSVKCRVIGSQNPFQIAEGEAHAACRQVARPRENNLDMI